MKIEVEIPEEIEARIVKDFLKYLWTRDYRIQDKEKNQELSIEQHFDLLKIYFSNPF